MRVVDLRTFEARATLRAPGFAVGAVWTNACLGPDERHAAAGAEDSAYQPVACVCRSEPPGLRSWRRRMAGLDSGPSYGVRTSPSFAFVQQQGELHTKRIIADQAMMNACAWQGHTTAPSSCGISTPPVLWRPSKTRRRYTAVFLSCAVLNGQHMHVAQHCCPK